MNIVVAIMCIIALAGGIWAWKVDRTGIDEEPEKEGETTKSADSNKKHPK